MNNPKTQSIKPRDINGGHLRTEVRSLGYGHKPSNVSKDVVEKASQDDNRSDNLPATDEDSRASSSSVNSSADNEPDQGTSRQPHRTQATETSQSQHFSAPATALHSTQPSLLPDHIFVSSVGKPYDRDWMVKHGIDEAVLQGFSSKHQFRSLIANGAIKIGDRLRVTYNSSSGAVNKEGTIMKAQGRWKCLPDIAIAVSRPGVAFITLHACAGPTDFISTMNGEFSATYGCSISTNAGWKTINLISSNGQDFGTLWRVRQAYHIWVEEKDKWAVRNGRPTSLHAKSTTARPSTNVPPTKQQAQ